MNTPTRQIPPERKAIYYGGMALIALGLLLFASNFFAGPEIGGRNRPEPGQLISGNVLRNSTKSSVEA